MGGLFETDPETGARRPRVPLLPRFETVLSPSMPPTDEITPPTAAAPPPLAPQPAGDVSEPRRPESPGRLASILASADDSPVGAPSAMPVAERRPGADRDRPRTSISVETPPQQQTISDTGLEFIKKREDFKDKIYEDERHKRTIGYGHLLLPGDAELYKHGIDKTAAEQLFKNDVGKAEKVVRTLVTVPLTQGQYNALVSFTYNIGEGNLAGSTFLRLLNDGNYRAAAEEILRWDKLTIAKDVTITSKGQVRRRQAERKMFLGDDNGDMP